MKGGVGESIWRDPFGDGRAIARAAILGRMPVGSSDGGGVGDDGVKQAILSLPALEVIAGVHLTEAAWVAQ